MFAMMKLVMRADVPGVVRTLKYRGEFFGDRMAELTQRVLRGPSEWSVGERELFAAWVSKANACDF
jgi:hypothetical protein